MSVDTSLLSDVKCRYLDAHVSGESVLDLCCGSGHYLSFLAKKRSGGVYVGVDRATSHATGIEFIRADLEEKLLFDDDSFDTVLVFDIIEYISSESLFFLSEVVRVCKPGGVVIGSVPHDDDRFLPSYNVTFFHRSDLTHRRCYTKESARKVLLDASIIVDEVVLAGGVTPQLIAEFVIPPMRFITKKMVGILRRVGVVRTDYLYSDIFFVAHKPEQSESVS